jgi:hypothetical protein
MMDLFLSWSGEKSRRVGSLLRNWLPQVLHAVQPWMSDEDIAAGERWSRRIASALQKARYGILVLTPENLDASWVLFEAGALSRMLTAGRLAPYLVGVDHGQLPGPLQQFQAARADRDGTWKLIRAINLQCDPSLTYAVIRRRFDRLWPELERSLSVISRAASRYKPRKAVHIAASREAAYLMAIEVIKRVAQEQKGIKSLLLPALHGYRRLSAAAETTRSLRAFNRIITECARSAGPNMWNVRQIFNITTAARLKDIMEIVNDAADADGYEVKAICVPDAMPPLAPLIIGNRDLLIGFDDPRYYRVGSAIHVETEEAVALATKHFEALWAHPTCVVLKSAIRIERAGFEELRNRLHLAAKHRGA